MYTEGKEKIWKGTDFWKNEIIKAGLTDKLPGFNDVLTGNEKPGGYGDPVLTNVMLDSRLCDVYHTDMDGPTKIKDSSGHRIYIHFKDPGAASPDTVPYYGPKEQEDDMHLEAGEPGKF